MRRGILMGALLGLGLLLSGCMPSMRPTVNSIAELNEGEAAVVGKVRLVPPMGKDEVMLEGNIIGKDRLRHVFLSVGPQPYEERGTPPNSVYTGAIETSWNELFFSRFKGGQPQYLQMAIYTLVVIARANASDYQRGFLRCNLKLNVRPEDEAVYIGTIVLHRNDFNQLEKVEVLDESESASKEIRRRLGKSVTIRKALAQKG